MTDEPSAKDILLAWVAAIFEVRNPHNPGRVWYVECSEARSDFQRKHMPELGLYNVDVEECFWFRSSAESKIARAQVSLPWGRDGSTTWRVRLSTWYRS